MIKSHSNDYPIRQMCRLLNVSSSGYYAWLVRRPSRRDIENHQLAKDIHASFITEKERAGSIRIMHNLREQGIHAGRHRIARLMRVNGWRAKAARKYIATTNSKHSLPVADNLLKQDFNADSSNTKWVSDITYIWTKEGWLYLAVVMDLYSRLVVGWSLSKRMDKALVIDALNMALLNRKNPRNVIVHSDRGSQYCSTAYQALLTRHNLICSMSKRGDCYDNAAMESWNHSFKVEAIHGEPLETRAETRARVFEYIEVYYNRRRRHSRLGYISPERFELKMVA